MPDIVKVKVSPHWTSDERVKVGEQIKVENDRLVEEYMVKKRETKKPYYDQIFIDNLEKRSELNRLKWKLFGSGATALEIIRKDFVKFIEN